MERARVPGWVWVVLVLAHGLALTWALHSGRWEFPDSGRYRQAAANLLQHGQLYARAWPLDVPSGQQVQEFTIRPPGYPVILVALGSATRSPWLVLLVQNGLSLFALGAVLSWWARRMLPSLRHWLGALVLILTFPAQIIYANGVMSETFLQSVLLALVAAIATFHQTGKLCYWLGAAGAVTLALLLKPVCCLLAVGLGLGGVVLSWQRRRWLLFLIGLLPLGVMGTYMVWNQQRTGYLHFSSIAEINLLHYNAAGVVRQMEGPAVEECWVANVLRDANAQDSFAARQRLIRQKATAVLLAHPGIYTRQHLLGIGAFFLDPGRFDISAFLGLAPLAGGGLLAQVRAGGVWQAIGQLPLGLLASLLVVLLANIIRLMLAVRGFRRFGWRTGQAGWWIAVGLLAYLAVLTGPLGAARFLMPAWPLLLGMALMGMHGPMMARAKPGPNAASA